MKRILLERILLVLIAFSFSQIVKGQTIVSYTMQSANFPTTFADGGGFFDPDLVRMGMYANFNAKQAVKWRTFKTAGDNTGSNRSLQVGDVFVITVSCTRAFGQIGFSLNAAGTQGSNYTNRVNGSRLYVNTDNYGAWYVNRSGGSTVLGAGYNPIQSTYKDYKFTIRITSSTTADVFLTVDGSDYRAFNLTMNGTANIDAFSVYGADMWDGDSNDDAFWKQTATVTNSKTVQLGYFMSSGTYTPGVISNGLDAASTITASVNDVFAGGNAGTFTVLNQTNTYSGATTVNTNARLELQNVQALGSTSGVTVQNNAALSLYSSGGGLSYNNYSTTLNGLGVSGADGALRSTGGTNIWPGAITLNSNSRINADNSGAAGSLTLSGGIGLGANNLTVGTFGANVTVSGIISGSGGSLTKDGTGTLNLTNTNTYSGATSVNAGTLLVTKSGYTATITTSGISLAFSPAPTRGTYAILPGALSSTSTLLGATGLAAGQTASFNGATGVLTVSETPSVTLTSSDADNTFCLGTSVTFTATASNVGGGSVTYDFKVNGSTVQNTGSNFYTTSGLTGTPTVTVVVNITGGTFLTTNTATSNTISNTVQSPTVTLATIASNNAIVSTVAKNGDVITLSFTTSENASGTPTVTINGNAASVSGSGTSWTATRTVSGDTNGVATFSISYQNSNGCTSATRTTTTNGSSVTVDTVAPLILSVSIYSNNANTSLAKSGNTVTVLITTSETPFGKGFTISGGGTVQVFGGGTAWSGNLSITPVSVNGVVTFTATISDVAGNTSSASTTTDSSSVTIDTLAPIVATAAIASNNTNPAVAGIGDIITLSFTTSETPTSTPVVTIGGTSAFVSGSGTSWSASKTVISCSNGIVPFSISISDAAGNAASRTATTDSSQVTITEINFNSADDNCDSSLFDGHAPVVVDVTTASGTLATMSSTITSSTATNTTPYSGASVTYKFKVTKTNAPTSVAYVSSNTTSFSFSSASNAAHSSTYDVQATAIVNGEEQPYNGNTESYTTPAAPTISNPPTQAGPSSVACAYTIARIDSYIYANNSTTYGATRYEFLVERMDNGNPVQTVSVATTVPYFKLTNIGGIPTTMQVTYGTTYRISVRYGYGATSFGSQIYTAYGSSCLVSTPALPVASVPCGSTLASVNAYIYASGYAAGANQFEFKVTRVSPQQPGELPITVTEEILPRNVANFRLTMLNQLLIGLQKEYSVSVRYRVTAYGMDNYSVWSTASCSLFTPDFPETQIIEAQCGVEGVPSTVNEYVYADGVPGATQYQFRLFNSVDLPYTEENPYDYTVYSPNNYVKLNQFPGLVSGIDYSVTVVAQLNGEYPNIALAKDCSITAPASTPTGPAKAVVAELFRATAYPNPFANNFMIAVKSGSQSAVDIKVYDMIGRLIESRKVTLSDMETTTIGGQYPSGVYNVVVSQDDELQTIRVVKR